MNIVIEKPNEKQKAFFEAKERFVAYGGARGGGKSWALRRKLLLLGVKNAGIKMLLIRRTFAELRENHILPLQSELKGIATYKDSSKTFTFVNGSRLVLGYMATEADVLQYQGQEYDIIALDEATQLTEYQFQTLTASLRGANSFPKRFYLTCNPGGVGHSWVKRLFIDKQYKDGERAEDYKFIQAKVYDNKALLAQDDGYIKMLENLPDDLREAWLNGNWDAFIGQYFSEFNREKHIIKPFAIPDEWRKYVAFDYGLDMFACYFIAMNTNGKAFVYREIYKSGLIVSEAAEELVKAKGNEQIYEYIAPPDLWNKHSDTGLSTADIFARAGIFLTRANNDRVQGWLNVKEWLKINPDEQGYPTPNLFIFENCVNLIRTLPQLQADTRNPNDTAREPHELTHAPDALRYFIAGRPRATETKPLTPHYNFEAERPNADYRGIGDKIKII